VKGFACALGLLPGGRLCARDDVLHDLGRRDLGRRRGGIDIVLGDMAIIAMAFVWFSTATTEAHCSRSS
jgi:hypothetical protein